MKRPPAQRRFSGRRLLCENPISRSACRSSSSASSSRCPGSEHSASSKLLPAGRCWSTSVVRCGDPAASCQRSSPGSIRYSARRSVSIRRSCEAVRSTVCSAAGERGRNSSHRSPRQAISASAKRVVRIRRGSPSGPAAARASASVRNERSGVSSARAKVCRVGVMAIRF